MKKEEKKKKKKRPFVSKMLILFLVLSLIYLYARYIGTTGLVIREYNIVDENIPISFDGFNIVHFSDLEYGSTVFEKEINTLVKKINDAQPDIVLFSGDLISETYNLSKPEKEKLINKLNEISPLIGKYSVKGDNDMKYYEEITNASNFKDITNTYEVIYYKGLTPIVLYGLDSFVNGNPDLSSTFSYPSNQDDMNYLANYKILLAHEPDIIDDLNEYDISLMLSGHSHNSQVNIPYLKELYKIDGSRKYFDSEYLVNDTRLYISGGIGTSKIKLRLFSKPSFNIYHLYTD